MHKRISNGVEYFTNVSTSKATNYLNKQSFNQNKPNQNNQQLFERFKSLPIATGGAPRDTSPSQSSQQNFKTINKITVD